MTDVEFVLSRGQRDVGTNLAIIQTNVTNLPRATSN